MTEAKVPLSLGVAEWLDSALRAPTPAAALASSALGAWRQQADSAERLVAIVAEDRAEILADEVGRVVFEASVRSHLLESETSPLGSPVGVFYPSSEVACWIRFAAALAGPPKDRVARWALDGLGEVPPRLQGRFALALASLGETGVRAACAPVLRAAAESPFFHDPVTQACWAGGLRLSAAVIDEQEKQEALFDAALEQLRAPSAEVRIPEAIPLGEARAASTWHALSRWISGERAGLGIWLVPQLPAEARAAAADSLLREAMSSIDVRLHHAALDRLAPWASGPVVRDFVRHLDARGVSQTRAPQMLARLAATGGEEQALSALSACPHDGAWAMAALAVLPCLQGDPARVLALRAREALATTPERWGPVWTHTPDQEQATLRSEAERGPLTHAGLFASALPADRLAPFIRDWLARGALRQRHEVTAYAWTKIAGRAADLPDIDAAQVLWGLLDALAKNTQPEVLDAVDRIDLSAAFGLIARLGGALALARTAEIVREVLRGSEAPAGDRGD